MSAHLLQAPSVHVTASSLRGNRSAQGDEGVSNKVQQAQMQFVLQHQTKLHCIKKKKEFFRLAAFVDIVLFYFKSVKIILDLILFQSSTPPKKIILKWRSELNSFIKHDMYDKTLKSFLKLCGREKFSCASM